MLPLHADALRARAAGGETFAFRFFYGHQQRPDAPVSDAVFSQFYPASFEVNGQPYRWAEQWMMAERRGCSAMMTHSDGS